MNEDSVVYVGVDVAKAKHAVAIAESGRSGEVRYVGEIETTPAAVERFVRKLARKHPRLHFCYEAGPTGYGLYRQLVALGHACEVVAPSLIPQASGRARQDQPTRRRQFGSAPAGGRAQRDLGSGRGA